MDLNAPLGLEPKRKPRRQAFLYVGAAGALIVIGAIGLLLVSTGRHVERPSVVATIPPQILEPVKREPVTTDPAPTGSIPAPASAQKPQPSDRSADLIEHGVKVVNGVPPARVTQPPLDSTGPLIIDVTRALDGARHGQTAPTSKTAAVSSLAGTAGATPQKSSTAAATTNSAARPQVALFIEGMGLGTAATRKALDTMPPGVSLAFVPYGSTIGAFVASAKAKGHEILLQLPMQNAQGGGPGPHTLRPGEAAADVDQDLAWLTGQFQGYDGVVNLLGGPVTADAATMTAVLKAVGNKGLFYLDDGTSKRSLAAGLAERMAVPVVKADIVLDATADPAAVRANLETLVAIAKRKGSAIGMASGLPDHLGMIARFAGALSDHGVQLVPVNALVRRGTGVANAR